MGIKKGDMGRDYKIKVSVHKADAIPGVQKAGPPFCA